MDSKNKITVFQYFLCVILSSIFVTFGLFNNITSNSLIEATVTAIVGIVIFAVVCIPTYFVYKNTNKNPIEIISEISFPFSFIIKLYYLLIFFIFTSSFLAQYIKFFKSQINKEASIFFIIFTFVIICCFGCLKGSQPLFRTGVIIFVFCIIVLMFLIFGVTDKINFNNASLNYSLKSQLTNGLNTVLVSLLPLTTFVVFSDSIKGNVKSGIIYSSLALFVMFLFFSVLVIMVMGDFSNIVNYPVFIFSKVANISMIKGGDGMFFALITAVTFLIVYLYFVSSAKVMNSSQSKVFPIGFAFAVLVFGTLINHFVKLYEVFTDTLFLSVLSIIALVVIPTLSYVIIKIRGTQ